MKKVFVFLLVLVLSSCDTAVKEQRFVNPLFYETLHPFSSRAWETHLTPTKITLANAGYSEILNCELVENTAKKVALKCTWYNELAKRDVTYVYAYTIAPCSQYICHAGQWEVKEETSNVDGDIFSKAWFAIKEN